MSLNKKILSPYVLTILAVHTGVCYYFQWPIVGALGAGLIIGGHLGIILGTFMVLHKFFKVLPTEFMHAVIHNKGDIEVKMRRISAEEEAEFDNLIKQAEHDLNKKD